ncbi:nucleotidyltransferase family protein [Streptococcus orisratti]|uniref:nucleotidyltransferase family protein n=1 Tax=Streptococcus orisratti TaxID=114652 RepID=UPI0023F707B3|nr:nucleotidyltransferase domain-containing protein [Streptococcus orisratti]
MVYTIEEIKNKVYPIAQEYNLSKLYLFGSYSRGEADNQSDIDLVYAFDNEQDAFNRTKVYRYLIEAFDCDVDVIGIETILNGKSPISKRVKENFEKERVVLYEKSGEFGDGLMVS